MTPPTTPPASPPPTPGGDPYAELVAALDAGTLDAARARDVRAGMAATTAELAAEPRLAVPPDVAARWAAAVTTTPDRRATGQRAGSSSRPVRGWRPALAAAAAVLAVLAGLIASGPRTTPDLPRLARIDLAAAGAATVGVLDAGALADPGRRAGCLRAVGLAPDAALIGGRPVLLDGRPGTVLVLGTGELGRFQIVVVDPACGPDGGTLIARTTLGGR